MEKSMTIEIVYRVRAEGDATRAAEEAGRFAEQLLGNEVRRRLPGAEVEFARVGADLGAELAHRAVSYVLKRAQEDADLGHLIGPCTQAFELLCAAEAARGERAAEEVKASRGRSLTTRPRRFLSLDEWQGMAEDADGDGEEVLHG
jgi:hypothetical protein